MEAKEVITLGIAAYGAALSTYNLFQALQRDRKRVKVTMNTAMYVYGGDLGPAMIGIEVVNVGHRPVSVSAPSLELKNGRKVALIGSDGFNEFPRQLTDGASAAVRVRYRHVAEALANAGYPDQTEIRPVCTDTTGKSFYGKSWRVNVPEWLGM